MCKWFVKDNDSADGGDADTGGGAGDTGDAGGGVGGGVAQRVLLLLPLPSFFLRCCSVSSATPPFQSDYTPRLVLTSLFQ